jgi:hypothetical protein
MPKPTGATCFRGSAATTREDWPWLEALGELDFAGNKKPLTDLLRSDRELSPIVRELLADLIERGVPYPTHRPTTPAYTTSRTEQSDFWAHRDIKALVKSGMPLKDALGKVASEHGLNVSTLRSSYKRGKR